MTQWAAECFLQIELEIALEQTRFCCLAVRSWPYSDIAKVADNRRYGLGSGHTILTDRDHPCVCA